MALNSDYQAFKNVVAARRSVYALNAIGRRYRFCGKGSDGAYS